VTDRPAQRPVDFDLAAAWEAVVVDMEGRRSKTWATVLTDRQFVPILHDQFGRHCEVVAELDDGRSKVRLGAPTPLDIARNLAGWGAAVEVLEPSDVRAELDRIGGELVNGTKNGT
jgi:predicted DNA-binding transcriptional regulator YafY